ncbi:DNA-processing protein DprA [Clostridium gasigenes]|uniref:DNA-protecting protein DprA n=1 Tax=Clostridium gasigenes TaxID=94869 RepID=A0A7X0SCR8_9CLOT|nr:DNA-protecting protein DprA [Clostridium gasigenes]
MEEFILWFILLEISNESKIKLLGMYENEEVIHNNIDNIVKARILRGKRINNLKTITLNEIREFKKYLNKEGIGYITYTSIDYPMSLMNLKQPPYILFYRGDKSLLKDKTGGIVGSRNCTNYGREVTKRITKELCLNSITIVSGVASGIDSIAHKVAVEEGGRTIGVLGCGIDVVYPKINKKLYKDIERTGLLLSEFFPGTEPRSYNFPRRNRIISGLSEKLVVIEASLKSGSLITVGYALEEGKSVMAVPGSVLQSNSTGCNKLIGDGASTFAEMEDLRTFFGIYKNSYAKVGNGVKDALLTVISSEPKHLDDIIERVNVDRKVLFGLLFEMQNRNEIICLPGNYYAKLS